jgi:hypothetical protein
MKELDGGTYAYEKAPDVAGYAEEASVDGDASGVGLTSHL